MGRDAEPNRQQHAHEGTRGSERRMGLGASGKRGPLAREPSKLRASHLVRQVFSCTTYCCAEVIALSLELMENEGHDSSSAAPPLLRLPLLLHSRRCPLQTPPLLLRRAVLARVDPSERASLLSVLDAPLACSPDGASTFPSSSFSSLLLHRFGRGPSSSSAPCSLAATRLSSLQPAWDSSPMGSRSTAVWMDAAQLAAVSSGA